MAVRSEKCASHSIEELPDLVAWYQKVVGYGAIVASIIIIILLVVLYVTSGERNLLLLILLLAATLPIDLILVRSLMVESGRLLGRTVLEALTELSPRHVSVVREWSRVYAAARLEQGDLHLVVGPGRVEAALVESPSILPSPPGAKLVKELLQLPRCGEAEGTVELEAVLLDPVSGCRRLVRGRARVAGYRCGRLELDRVRSVIARVAGRAD
ncbi:MAG: hypothetical protein GXO43_01675 [Crenarchaeota archaeon]|nr:hypothetical protein [Thermoproteota archaeon]